MDKTALFVTKANNKHNNKYDYSKVNYTNNTTEITIICPKHGEYQQTPKAHFRGCGCPDCGKESVAARQTKTTAQFIIDAKVEHGNTYNYSKVNYTTNKNNITIICNSHGEFYQAPDRHLGGQGCPKCGRVAAAAKQVKTTAQFIIDANVRHRNKYNYSKVKYRTSKDNVIIICNQHGEFHQDPNNHLNGQGCPDCGKESSAAKQAKTTPEFIIDAKEVHGDRYDYSAVDYITNKDYITIICLVHDDFQQTPSDHLSGRGCMKCGKESMAILLSKTTPQFIIEANEIHRNKYDYSKVVYDNSRTYIIIICPIHKDFKQIPGSHLSGHGCPKCGKESTAILLSKTTPQFIIEAKDVHKNKYDYSKVDYTNSDTKVVITCPVHKDFRQIPSSHLRGYGCLKCGRDIVTILQAKTTAEFIIDAKKVHGNKYDYSKVEYSNNSTKVVIICLAHGNFSQSPKSHLNKNGCPCCVNKTESIVYEYLDSANIQHYRQFSPHWLINTETGGHRRFDVLIPKYKLIVEIDGPQHFRQISNWDSPEIQRVSDVNKMFLALENDYSVVRLLQEDIFNDDFEWKKIILKNLIDRPEPEIVYQNNTTYNDHEMLFYDMCVDRYSI